jgi:hypothetical protein
MLGAHLEEGASECNTGQENCLNLDVPVVWALRSEDAMTLDELTLREECATFVYELARHLDNHEFEDAQKRFTADAIIQVNDVLSYPVSELTIEKLQKDSFGYKPRQITSLTVTPTGPASAKVFCYCTIVRDAFPSTEWHFDLVKTPDGWRCTRRLAAIVERFPGEVEKAFEAQGRLKPKA